MSGVGRASLYRRLYLYASLLVGHGWETAAFWIASAYSIFNVVAPDWLQRKFFLLIHVDPGERLAVLGFGLAAFFLYAGFRTWSAEYQDKLALGADNQLSKKVDALEQQLAERKLREWPRLPESQKIELARRLRKIGSHTIWIIRPENFDCIGLAADFGEAFRKASWEVPALEPYSVEELQRGITIRGLHVAAQESLRNAITEVTGLPVMIYEGNERERKYWDEKAIVLNIGVKSI